MTRSALSTQVSVRPRASVLAVLFALAAVAAPAVDAWLHAGDAAVAVQHSGPSDCVVCRVAATPLAPSPPVEVTVPESTSAEHPRFAPVQAQLRAAPARLRPPTRAPPA